MAARTLANLIDETRNFLRDTPDYDTLTASSASTATTLTVADATLYRARWPIEIDYETMMIRAASGTTLTVSRAWRGSTSASHASGAAVLLRPAFYTREIVDAINMGIDACFPYVYKLQSDTSTTATDSTYEYTLPNLAGTYEVSYQIPLVVSVESKQPGDLTYRKLERWGLVQAPNGSRGLKLRYPEPAGTLLRITGYGPFPHLSAITDILDAAWPMQCQHLPVIYAAAHLLMSGEAGRDRFDVGPVDRREEANKPGISLQLGQYLLQRFWRELMLYAMPPLPKHMKQPL